MVMAISHQVSVVAVSVVGAIFAVSMIYLNLFVKPRLRQTNNQEESAQ